MMTLGTLTFTRNPSDMTVLTPERASATVKTYTSVAFFSWGVSIVGKEIELVWSYMPIAMYNDLAEIFAAAAGVVFDPDDDNSTTYNVEVTGLDGKYLLTHSVTDGAGNRKDVRLRLLILSEVGT